MTILKYAICFYAGGMVAHFPTIYLFGIMGEASISEIVGHVLLWPHVYSIFFI